MSIQLWAFKDGEGIVRITPNDPAAHMGIRALSTILIPGGFSMRELRRHLESATTTLMGKTGDEAYLRLDMDDLNQLLLEAMMTQVSPNIQ